MMQFRNRQSNRVGLYINCKTTGHIDHLTVSDSDRLADEYELEDAWFQYAGCLDATHVMPAGSTTGNPWSGVPGTSKIYRGDV